MRQNEIVQSLSDSLKNLSSKGQSVPKGLQITSAQVDEDGNLKVWLHCNFQDAAQSSSWLNKWREEVQETLVPLSTPYRVMTSPRMPRSMMDLGSRESKLTATEQLIATNGRILPSILTPNAILDLH